MISVPFELERMEFGILISDIPLSEKSQNEMRPKHSLTKAMHHLDFY